MNMLELLAQRNKHFAEHDFAKDLKMLPSQKAIIVGCVDPRVDPADVLGLEAGEAVVIRNVGGRITKSTLESMALVGKLAKAAGKEVGQGWNLMLLQHTDCGINGCARLAPDLLAQHLGVKPSDFDDIAITDPYRAIAIDVELLRADPAMPAGLTVCGVVYDVATGLVETVVEPVRLGTIAD